MKTIQNFLTESKYKGNIANYSQIISKIYYDILEDIQGKSLKINLNVGNIELGKFKDNAIKRSIGHIIESYILATIQSYQNKEGFNEYFTVTQTNDDVYDADITFYNVFNDIAGKESEKVKVEVKAYTGSKENINFSKKQQTQLTDTLFIYVEYTYSNSSVKIEDILIGTFNDVQNGKNTIGKHGGKTKNMVSTKQNKEDK